MSLHGNGFGAKITTVQGDQRSLMAPVRPGILPLARYSPRGGQVLGAHPHADGVGAMLRQKAWPRLMNAQRQMVHLLNTAGDHGVVLAGGDAASAHKNGVEA